MMTFGQTLRASRQTLGSRLIDIATEIGVSTGHLSRLERDLTGSVDAALIRRLSHAYRIPTEQLLDLLDGSEA